MQHNDIYDILKSEILNLQLLPGQMISENAIAKRFNVSRTPVRSVFDHLVKDDLLEVIPKKGTFVTLLDLDAIDQIIYMRARVEIGIMTMLAKHPDPVVFEKLRENLNQLEQALKSGITPDEFYDIDSKFHELCMIAANKHMLWSIIQKLNVHYTRYRMLDYVATHRFGVLYQEHCILLDCMVNGRVDKIEKYVTEHLCGSFVSIGNRLTTEFKDYFAESQRSIFDILGDIYTMIRMANESSKEESSKDVSVKK